MRMKDILSLLFFMLVILGSILIIPKEFNAEATGDGGSGSNGLVGLDYQEIFNKTKLLTKIVFNITDNGLYKGRWFGSEGEREAARMIERWMENYTDNLAQITNVEINREPVTLNQCVNISGYGLKLYNDTCTANIPNNESFPIAASWSTQENPKNFSYKNVHVINYTEDMAPDETLFNVSYIRLNDSNSGLYGEVVYIENYSNVSEYETSGRVHLINVSNNEYNDTVDLIANLNGIGFILMRDNVSEISSRVTSIPGVAVSKEKCKYNKRSGNK